MKKQLPSETAIVVPVLARLSRSLAVFTLLLLTFPMLLARPALAEHRTLDVDAARPGSPQQYTVTDLRIGWSSGINASGQVVGSDCGGCVADLWRALLWSDGVITDLGTLPDYGFLYSSFAGGINASGQVVGHTYRIECYELVGCFYLDGRAFLWSDGVMSSLGTLPGHTWSSASGINDSGQVVGSSSFESYPSRAFLWSDGVMSDLGAGEATGINDSGQVVGSSGHRAFLWSDGVMTDLGTLPGFSNSDARGINAFGQVIGESYSEGRARAFLWSEGVMSDLGTLPDDAISSASGINAFGQVVGVSGSSPVYRAFLWSDGVMSDLNDLIPPDSGWVLFSAAAINDAGQIVGSGSHNGGRSSAFLLTPIK